MSKCVLGGRLTIVSDVIGYAIVRLAPLLLADSLQPALFTTVCVTLN